MEQYTEIDWSAISSDHSQANRSPEISVATGMSYSEMLLECMRRA